VHVDVLISIFTPFFTQMCFKAVMTMNLLKL
jgi:hypothetical protein